MGADAERMVLEAKHARRLTSVLRAQLREILPADMTPTDTYGVVARLYATEKPLRDALYAMLLEGARLGADHGQGQVLALHGTAAKAVDDGINVDWGLIHEDARVWASQYAGTLVQGITTTSSTVLQGALSDYIGGSLTYKQMIAQLAPTFGSQRANTIATTEVTRSFSEGNRAAWKRLGAFQWFIWQTANDELVCPVCTPRNGVIYPLDGEMPPAHVRCRCWTSPSVDPPEGEEAPQQERPTTPAPRTKPVAPENPFLLRSAPAANEAPMTMPDLLGHMQTIEARYALNDVRLEQLENLLDGVDGGKVVRPPWGTGMTDQTIAAVAKHFDISPFVDNWWSGPNLYADQGEMQEILSFYRQVARGGAAGPQTPTAMRQEMRALRLEQRQILAATQHMDAAGDVPLYRPLSFADTGEPLPF